MAGEEGPSLKLLSVRVSPYSIRVELALALKGLSYEVLPQDLRNKSKLLLHSNPVHRKAPVLIHQGKPLCESCIIVQYIDEVWPSPHRLLPEDPFPRAIARFWADYIDTKLLDVLSGIISSKGEEQKEAIENALKCLAVVEEALRTVPTEPPFFGGGTIGYVDIILGPLVSWFPAFEAVGDFKFPFEDKLPCLNSWLHALKKSSIGPTLPDAEEIKEFAVHVMRKKLVPT